MELGITYDKLQRLTDIVQTGQPSGNAVAAKHVAFDYNTLSQLTKISRYQSTGTANPVATTDFAFDSANRLSGIAHKQGATDLNTYAYTYDRMSRLSTVTSTAEGLTSYSYDQVSQLVGAINTFGNDETYGYDANGNRNTLGYTVEPDNRTMTSPSARSTPAYSYLYDDEGNITRRQNSATLASTYNEYDHRNRLVSVSGQQNPIAYEYDAYNRLVSRSDISSFTFWSYDTGINPVLEFDSSKSSVLTHRCLWSNSVDELLADEKVTSTSSVGNTLWGLADHLGTIRDIADANEATGVRSVVNHRRYNAFGKLTFQTGPADIIFGYTGKYSDAATGLQNNLNRWYDPNLGKWISQDPIGFAGGDANLYRYVGNSPTMSTDPSGLWQEPVMDDYLDPEVRKQNENERNGSERAGKKLALPPLPPYNPYTNRNRGHFLYPFDSSGKCWTDGGAGGLPPTPIYVPGSWASGGTKLTTVANKGHVYVIVETPDGHTHSYGAYPSGKGIGNVQVDTDLKSPAHAVNSITYVLSQGQEKALGEWVNTPWAYDIDSLFRHNRRVCIDYAEDLMDFVLRADSKIEDGEFGWGESLTVGGVISEIERRKNYRREFLKSNPLRQPSPAPPLTSPDK